MEEEAAEEEAAARSRAFRNEYAARRDFRVNQDNFFLYLRNPPFTRHDAQFLIDDLHERERNVGRRVNRVVHFRYCTFEDVETVDILANGFATEALSHVTVRVEQENFQVDRAGGIRSFPYFPSVMAMVTYLTLSRCSLSDDDFGYVVDTILTTISKKRLASLCVGHNNISSNGLAHAMRLVRESKLINLWIGWNPGLLRCPEQMRSFCDDGLKHSKHLKRIYFYYCGASDNEIIATADMIAKNALTVNTSLTEVVLYPQRIDEDTGMGEGTGDEALDVLRRRLYPLLRRNIQLSLAQSLLEPAEQNPVATPAVVWQHMDQHWNSEFLGAPDLSALFLLLRNVTVGQDGEAVQLLVEKVAPTVIEQDRRQRSSTRIQHWWRQNRPSVKAGEQNASLLAELAAFRACGKHQRDQSEQGQRQIKQQKQQQQQQQQP